MKKPHKLIIKLALSCFTLGLLAFIPRDEDPLSKLVTNLQRWTDSIPQEKVYLHMDKPYYALGDTIWFKGYLTIGSRHQLSALSGAIYVELINQNDSLIQQLKLPVTSGMVIGDFILKDNYQQGNYRLRAYTQWMRNAGEDYFYDHTFLVGDIAGGNIIAKADFAYKTDKGKTRLQAVLNYTNNAGSVLGKQNIRYEIKRKNKAIWQQNSTTDASGNLAINIPDDVRQNSAGAYIRTYLKDGKNTIIREFPIKAALSQSDVQFFPESGNLVNGLSSHVAFKAVGIDGLGINIKGTITDNNSNQLAQIETLHAGMGSFLLKPEAGKTYSANITFDDGSTKTILLPKAADQGYVLSVYQPNNDSILVRVQASAPLLQSTVNIIAHTNGQVVLSSPIKVEKPITSIWLDKKAFPTGIAQFTLFDSSGEPLNERIAFIRSNDRLSLDLKTAKTTYGSKEHVLVELNAKDSKGQPTFGNFSVSVIDESKVPFDENKESTIFSNLLLTSDLKGYVEQPNYYFNNENQEVDKAMDNLMLTQGYRRFTWKELNNAVTTKPKFAVEGLGVSISGTVTTLSHRILPNAKVELISLRAKVAKSTTTDANGHFSFDSIFMTDSIKFTVQARMGTSDHAILTLDTLPKIKINPNINLPDVSTNIAGSLKAFLNNAKNDDDIYEKMGLLDKVHRLREVNIRAKKLSVPAGDIAPQGMFKINEQSADQVINVDADEASHYISLAQYLQARLQGIRIGSGPDGSTLELLQGNSTYRSSFRNADNPIALYIDGRKLNPQQLSEALDLSYAPEDIAKIEVVRSNQAMVNFLGGPGVLILTRLGSSRRIYNPSIANISPKGFNRVREFYIPRYDRRGVDLNQPDLRTTIYWNPYLKTDASGNCSFNFYNADGSGTYKVVVEGINAAGELGRQVYRYTVDGGQASANLNYTLPATDKNLAKITAPLDSFNQRLPVEKVYLHTDKPYYNIGDTLWFKSYVLDGVNLAASHRSGILYVELDDDSTNVVRRVSIPIKDGIGRGQIPLKPVMFKEGGYTLRAYTNWMQNFDGNYVFTQRFYLGIPSTKSWLVNSASKIQQVGNKDRLQANLKLTHADDPSRAVAYQKVEVKVYDEWHYLSKQEMQTGSDGSLNISQELGRKSDGRRIRVQITSLNKDDGYMITQVPLIINRNQNIDVQFLPESGNLVAGIKSVVGFKAIAEDGRGTAVTGGIFDSQNNQVASFMPLHDGMGSFEFTPKAGEHYKAQISEPVAKAFELPKIQPAGTVMHVDNPEQGDSLKIELFGTGSLPADSACYLIGMARGVIYYSQKVDLNNSTFSVAKNQFPTGITRFTFFKGRTPLNERAVFINNNDASIKPNKGSYLKRDSVGLEIEVKDKSGMPVQGSFSLAVTDDSQVKPDSLGNNGKAASLLLKSELKGEIENPGYYLTHKDKQAWQALDNLMLTQGWTGYDWRDVFAPAKPVKFKVEQPYVIRGRASNVSNKPLVNSTVRVTSLRPVFSDETTTDAKGLFEFKNLPHIDSGAYLLQAINVKGKVKSFGEVSVERFQSVIKPEAAKILATPWYVNTDTVELNYVKRKAAMGKDDYELTGRVLKEVKINSTKIIPNSRNVFGP
ncbi:MAG TPA: carboxypeptidase regulatory-like domain-containing protein, partial [Mucilaginibacter sp.]